MDYLVALLLLAGNVLGAGMIVPQVFRLHRFGTADGVSAVGVGVGIAQNLWWVIYGMQAEGALGIVPVSVAGVVLYATIAGQLISLDGWHRLRPMLGGAAAIGVIPAIPLVLADLRTTGLVIGLLYTVQFAPAAVALMRTRVPVGVSVATWSMAWTEAVIWFIYGLIGGDLALTVGGAGGAVLSGIILLRLFATRPRVRHRLAVQTS